MKNKVIFFHPSTELYGADKILLEIISALKDMDITVFLPGEGILVEVLKKRFRNINIVIEPDMPVIARKYFTFTGVIEFVKKSIRFRKKIQNEFKDADAVYLNTLAVIPVSIFCPARLKIITHVHEILDNSSIINRLINKFSLKKSTTLFCVSHAVADKFKEIAGSDSLSSKIRVIHNGLDLNKDKNSINVDKKKRDFIKFALIGRYKPAVKGQLFLISALSRLPEPCLVRSHFYLVGSTVAGQEYMEEEIKDAIQKNKLDEFVTLVPFVKEIGNIYRDIDVALVPSVRADPLPTTVIEGMAYGCPVIGTNIGGIPEMIEDGYNGFLVSPDDVEGFSKRIQCLIEDENLRENMGNNGRKKYLGNFTKDEFLKSFRLEMNRILNFS